ncbi:uncharacterized protein F4807DRAFT_427428 [Annulohypoxylon truncatum]|uniref:uncharacterized protein n=1 Tax=Annulohypoxylon truncatum TaxID=327061 RepID=UPI00200894D4|nr:uncharacterized protein F4807DRAFT_427428 [Annulohypoxylon truncatum]KAI1209171.1 hypothetical protein F4807DRAFT_427428 [Annulohypoxylon truncatum]
MLQDRLQDLVSEQLQRVRGGIPPFIRPKTPMSGWPHKPEAIWDDDVVLTPYVSISSRKMNMFSRVSLLVCRSG